MAIKDESHHSTDLILLPIAPRRNTLVHRPPLPVAQIYPANVVDFRSKKVERAPENLVELPPRESRKSAGRKSMFFRLGGRGIEDDPFLKRLSRLN